MIGLPVLALGPDVLPQLFPTSWQPFIETWVGRFYYPGVALLLVLSLSVLYKLALPRKLPWHRVLPGAILAMAVFILSSIGLRLYIQWITTTGYTYGALATPIAFLLFVFFIGLAITIGAYFNSAIQDMWPARMTRRQRRRWRRLEMERAASRIREEGAQPRAGQRLLRALARGHPAHRAAQDPGTRAGTRTHHRFLTRASPGAWDQAPGLSDETVVGTSLTRRRRLAAGSRRSSCSPGTRANRASVTW